MKYPWIVKPLNSIEGTKADIKRIYNESDWQNYILHCHCRKVQVQELIEKDFEYQLIGCSLEGGNKLIIPGISYIIRPSAFSNTGFLRYESSPNEVSDLSLYRNFMSRIGYEGLFSIELIRGVDGKDYFMETNFRNDGNAICVTAAGVNLPYIWYKYCMNGDYLIEKLGIRSIIYANPFFSNLYLMITGKISFIEWISDLCKTNIFMEYWNRDKYPFFVLLSWYLRQAIKKIKI